MYDRVLQAQANIAKLLDEMQAWGSEPLFERKEGNKKALLQIDDRTERVHKRYDLVLASSKKAQIAMEENYRLFFNLPEPTEEEGEEEEAEEVFPSLSLSKLETFKFCFIIRL